MIYSLLIPLALVVSLFLIEVKDKKQTSFLKTTGTNSTINAGVKGADSFQRARVRLTNMALVAGVSKF